MCSAERLQHLQRKPRQLDKTIETFSGKLMQDGRVFQQNFLIRSYELDPDGKASIETLVHHLQVLTPVSLGSHCMFNCFFFLTSNETLNLPGFCPCRNHHLITLRVWG
jgi:hypothetical protein